MFPCISWEGLSYSRFPSREKIRCFQEKMPPFQTVQERSCPGAILFEKTTFSKYLKKISYFHVFFWERSSFIFRLGLRSYFQEKEISYFKIIQERSNSSAIFLERPSFQDVWKKKTWFSVQFVSINLRVNKLFEHFW